jgi:hypothetical protein
MKTLTSTIEIEIGSEFEETTIPHAMNDRGDTPRPDEGDETIDPNKPKKPKDPSEEEDEEVRPYNF